MQYDSLSGGISDVFMNIISRNMFYDNNIVPEYVEGRFSTKTIDKLNYGEHKAVPYRLSNGKLAYGLIVTNRQNAPYMKIIKGDTTVLYHRVG